jgi:glycosyltransferase involved in cell wall biosynthesis
MSTSGATVSVIIPCLNAEATLAEAIGSALDQTVPPLEVLVMDDGSTDRSVEIAGSFGPPVRVLPNREGCTGGARGGGTREAQGTYVTFCDADDTIHPAKIEKQLAVLANADPNTLVHAGAEIVYDDRSRPPYFRKGGEAATGRCLQVVFEHNPVCGASVMMRRATILKLGNYDPDLRGTDDYGLSLVAATRCDFVYLAEPLYRMRRHRGNMTNHKADMAYYHWLAQDKFRRCCPEAFAKLPAESIRRYMIEPVLRAVREAYWQREPEGYRQLLSLARRLAPEDPEIRRLWRRRWCPMPALRFWDLLKERGTVPISPSSDHIAVWPGAGINPWSWRNGDSPRPGASP